MIRAVLFDMYETLCTHYRSPLYFGAQIAADCGVAEEAFLRLWRDREREEARTLGRLTLEELLEDILPRCGAFGPEQLRDTIGRVCQRRSRVKAQCLHTLHPEILPLLWHMKARGLKLAVISNCYSEEAEAIEGWPEGRCFEQLLLSCRLGLMKPDPAIFRLCTERLGVAPGECLYIGDGGSRELETAYALGMRALQATWYMEGVAEHPSQVKPAFVQLSRPMEALGWLDGGRAGCISAADGVSW